MCFHSFIVCPLVVMLQIQVKLHFLVPVPAFCVSYCKLSPLVVLFYILYIYLNKCLFILFQVRSALSGLEELDLSDLRYLSDLTFNRLTGCTPRLRRLSLAGCHIAFEFDPYRGCPVGAVKDSSALLSLRNLRRLLTEQKSTVVALDLSRTSITPESLRTIAQVRMPLLPATAWTARNDSSQMKLLESYLCTFMQRQ